MIQYFALCGAPSSGKTEVQKILAAQYGVIPIDDKRALRDAAKLLYGLTEEDVSTQAGKARKIRVGDREITIREVLGKLGEYLEENDPLHFPKRARIEATENHPDSPVSFGSVRMQQAMHFQDEKSLVIEVVRPGIVPVNAFDMYDSALAHVRIINNYDANNVAESAKALVHEVDHKIRPFL